MRSFDLHKKNIQEPEKGSIDKLKADFGQKEECEVRTYGVKGRRNDF